MFRRLLCLSVLGGLVTAFGVFAGAAGGSAATGPSGQVMYGGATFDPVSGHFVGGGGTIEPAYDDATGNLIYLQTPNNVTVHPNDHNTAPIYLPMYPTSSGIDPASLNCAHLPADNCPDHGPLVAGLAIQFMPNVYHAGAIAGHDHLVGIASSGGDFNVIWVPVLVLFTQPQYATEHITTLKQINADVAAGRVMLFKLPPATFHCSAVSAASYARGTPAPAVTVPGT